MPQVRQIRFHDLRHTTASLLLQAGASIVAVSAILGHADVRITLDRYGHLAPDFMQAEVDKLRLIPRPAPDQTEVPASLFRAPGGQDGALVGRTEDPEKRKAGGPARNLAERPAFHLERETGFEPATLSLGS